MEKLVSIYGRVSSQLWHILVCSFFFFAFCALYKPFDMYVVLNVGGNFYINVLLMSCIVLCVLTFTRSLFLILYRYLSNNWVQYMCWIILELTIISYFFALYLFFVLGREVPYFECMPRSLEYCFLVLIYPVFGVSVVLGLISTREKKEQPVGAVMRFCDAGGRLKIAVARESLLYINAEENYIRIHYLDGSDVKDYRFRATMASIEGLAAKNGLFRCQRAYYVNPSHIRALRKDSYDQFTAELDVPGISIPVTRKMYGELSQLI